MNETRVERKLAAILAADVVGYSRLMASDEKGTHARLKALRKHFIEPTITEHHGRVVKLMGDGILVEFGSAVDAVECAIAIQEGVAGRQAEVGDDQRIALRIGINIGDIIIEDDDIYGGGVNIAARLEALAEPGGVLIARDVYSQVKNKVKFGFEPAGAHKVKNIPEPVEVYRVVAVPSSSASIRWWFGRRHPARMSAAAALGLLIVVGGLVWLSSWLPSFGPAIEAGTALPLPEEPSIAILPFDNLSDDSEQEYFADGVTEDLITDLAKIDELFVIARNSTFVYKDKAVDAREVAEDLGVRYVLEGSVRRANDRVRINAQLIDATTGGHIWAERYDGTLGDIFGLQDQVVEKIVGALAVELPSRLTARSTGDAPAEAAAYDAFLRGWAHYRHGTPADFAAAIEDLERALKIDPTYARAHAALAAVYAAVVDKNWSTGTSMWSRRLGMNTDHILEREEYHLAQALDSPVPLAHQVAAMRFARQGQHEAAVGEGRRALALDPNDPNSHRAVATALVYAGRPVEAADRIARAMRLDPHFPQEYLYWLGLAQFEMERFDEAAETLARATEVDPEDDRSLIVLAATYGHLGRVEKARAAIDQANRIRHARQEQLDEDLQPGIDVLLVGDYSLKDVDLWPFARSADRERLREGLAHAGVPEGGAEENVSPVAIAGATTIDAQTAKTLFERGVTFIDVRGHGSWADGHVPGAIHLDLKTAFSEEVLLQFVEKDEELVIYCMGPRCLLSSEACRQAVAWGFQKVHYFRDGFPSWKAAGFPVALPQKDATLAN